MKKEQRTTRIEVDQVKLAQAIQKFRDEPDMETANPRTVAIVLAELLSAFTIKTEVELL